MRLKVLLRTTVKPLGYIALDDLPHALHLTVHMAVKNRFRPPPHEYGHPLSEVSTISLERGAPDCSTPSSFSRVRPTALYVHDCGGSPSFTSIPVPLSPGTSTAWLHLAFYTDS
ncbi:hypothetical protein TcCL_NonESM11728 [Trypanosoma cruzi]|nr:hypothetical protein TcCL_NonESM11728 [Trypanosoma cruzi]